MSDPGERKGFRISLPCMSLGGLIKFDIKFEQCSLLPVREKNDRIPYKGRMRLVFSCIFLEKMFIDRMERKWIR